MKKWGTSLAGEMDRVIDAVGTTMRDVDSIVRTGQRRAALKAGTDAPAADDPRPTQRRPQLCRQLLEGSRNRPGSMASPTSNARGQRGAVQFADDLANQLKRSSPPGWASPLTWAVMTTSKLYSVAADTDTMAFAPPTEALPGRSDSQHSREPKRHPRQCSVITALKNAVRDTGPKIAEWMRSSTALHDVTKSQSPPRVCSPPAAPSLTLDQALRLKRFWVRSPTQNSLDRCQRYRRKTTAEAGESNRRDPQRPSPKLQTPPRVRFMPSSTTPEGVATFKNEMVKRWSGLG